MTIEQRANDYSFFETESTYNFPDNIVYLPPEGGDTIVNVFTNSPFSLRLTVDPHAQDDWITTIAGNALIEVLDSCGAIIELRFKTNVTEQTNMASMRLFAYRESDGAMVSRGTIHFRQEPFDYVLANKENEFVSNLNIFPNPATNQLNIHFGAQIQIIF